jgi:hypothetical protein
VTGALGGLVIAGCKVTFGASPSTPTQASIYTSLVEAGCLAAVEGGIEAGAAVVAQEQAATPPDPWMTCLTEGGTPQGCHACDGTQ